MSWTWGALEPDFIKLFEFVVNMGGNSAGFIDDLLDFASRLVHW